MMGSTPQRIVILAGLSGAGKTTATKSLEDIGFRTIDNLPHDLLPALAAKIVGNPVRFPRTCLVIDARDGDPHAAVDEVRAVARANGVETRMIFLDSRDDVLIRRFSETRHRHPFGGDAQSPRSVAEAISEERGILSSMRESADLQIDTSDISSRELRDLLVREASEAEQGITIRILSFGYKYGLPLEADLVFDVRSAANPHWVDALRPLDGRAAEIRAYVLADPAGAQIAASMEEFFTKNLAAYLRDGRARLTIAVGCTGGRHRSVVIAELIREHLAQLPGGGQASVEHRDIGRS